MQRWIIIAGVIMIVIGFLWPWISKLGLGKVPGDIVVQRENFTLYFPIVTSLIASVVLTLLFWLLRR